MGGLITRFHTDRAAFRVVILHKLAHLRNGDVNKAYFTWAIWWALVVAVLLPSLLKELRFPDDNLAGTAFVLTVLVYLTRNAVLRAREFYADARASAWDGRTGALSRVLETLPGARGGHLWAMFCLMYIPVRRSVVKRWRTR
jgi:Zn-dependent protease with chaperone function